VSPGEAFTVHTRWIETEFDNQIPAYSGTSAPVEGDHERETIVLEVNGKRVAVSMPAGLGAGTAAPAKGAGPAKRSAKKAAGAASGDSLTAPMQGTIVKVEVSEGDVVAVGDLIVVLEAMKMEQPLTAHKAGTVTGLTAEKGATVSSGTVLCEIKG
jgi:acetyl-CoA/propionyl-CoA carboxylase biotin carboxyl carrier protein